MNNFISYSYILGESMKQRSTILAIIILVLTLISTKYFIQKQFAYPIIREGTHTTARGGTLPCITEGFPDENAFTTLSVPTQINKIGDDYFIIDCYNNQVLYSDNIESPIQDWHVLTDILNRPHSIAGDGRVYLLDDTDNHQVLILEKENNSFIHTQTFENIGKRPHYLVYDQKSQAFWVLSSYTGEIYIFRRHSNTSDIYLSEIKSVPELYDIYVRSFSIIKNEVYLAATNGYIYRLKKNTFEIIERIPVPDNICGLVQVSLIGDYYYITVSTDRYGNQDTATMIRTNDLHELINNNYEEIYSLFTSEQGTPYYFNEIDDVWYLANHRTYPGIFSFEIENNEIKKIRELH